METFDDRPISVYDNLSAVPTPMAAAMQQTSTPKAKILTEITATPITTTTTATTTATTNGAARSPYSDIAFKFNDNQQHGNQQQQQQKQQLLPNGKQNQSQQQQQPSSGQMQLNNSVYYATTSPFKLPRAITTTTTTTAPPPPPPLNAQSLNATTTSNTTSPARAQRPLSQHSQTELNEASQSIAAVKAALNDAKSKFFGLNGYASDKPQININESQLIPPTQQHKPEVQIVATKPSIIIIPTTTTTTSTTSSSSSSSTSSSSSSSSSSPASTTSSSSAATSPAPVLPLPLPLKPQPKYQNIPENSAIFRKTPPELPPKPSEYQKQHSTTPTTTNLINEAHGTQASTTSTTSSPLSGPLSMSMATPTTATTAKLLPHASYKAIPLNDIDSSSSSPQPSQVIGAVYMATTVPQNIKGSKIAGRHTPTRSSLRHSRMIVVNNKNYQGIQHPNPMNFKQPQLARWLLILQILIGLLLTFLAIWIFLLAPNTPIQDNPYWSGLALLSAGILGLVLIRYQRIKRHKVRENCFLFLRADSYILSLLAALLCGIALVCAALHYGRLTASDTRCESTNILLEHGSCTCTFNIAEDNMVAATNNNNNNNNSTISDLDTDIKDRSYKFEYRDLSCQEVNGEWTSILELSIGLNSIGLLVAVFYIVLFIFYRHNSKRFYSSVHTSTF